MNNLRVVLIENDAASRAAIERAVRRELREYKLTFDAPFQDMEAAIAALRGNGQKRPDLVITDLYRREPGELDPTRLASDLVKTRVPKLERLRAVIGADAVLVVVSQYVGYFLRKLSESVLSEDAAEAAIQSVATALHQSSARVDYLIDKFASDSALGEDLRKEHGIYALDDGMSRVHDGVRKQADARNRGEL